MLMVPDLERDRDRLWQYWVQSHKPCRGTGFTVDDPDEDDWTPVPCSCQEQAMRELDLITAHVPREFRAPLPPEHNLEARALIDTYIGELKRHRQQGDGLILFGANGEGKTASACLVLQAALQQDFTAGYLTVSEFVTSIVTARDDTSLREWRESLLRADFLVLDELGKEHRKEGSEFGQAELDALLRWRRGEGLPTILVTNLTLVQMREIYGESLWSLFSDRMGRVMYKDGDYRQKRARRAAGV